MKIIFDNEQQKNHLIGTLCPYDINFDLYEQMCSLTNSLNSEKCVNCWENSEIELEVRNECRS